MKKLSRMWKKKLLNLLFKFALEDQRTNLEEIATSYVRTN